MVGSSGENFRYVRNTFIYDSLSTFTLLMVPDLTHTISKQHQMPWRFENNDKSGFKKYFIADKALLRVTVGRIIPVNTKTKIPRD